MPPEELLQRINWSRVGEVMRRPGLLDADLEEVAVRVAEVAAYYLPQDLLGPMGTPQEIQQEIRLSYQPSPTARVRTGIIDLAVRHGDTYALADWKLVQHAEWKPIDQERQEWDPAWAFYCEYIGKPVTLFTYRNVLLRPAAPRSKKRGAPPDVIEVELKPGPAVSNWLQRELQYTELLLDLFEGNAQVPWPQHAPGACMAFGTPCPYTRDCKTSQVPLIEIKQTISPSRIKELKLCPERARRDSVLSDDTMEEALGPEKAELGSAFHRGMAECYRQAWEVVCGV